VKELQKINPTNQAENRIDEFEIGGDDDNGYS
jgi:hypothetical protein